MNRTIVLQEVGGNIWKLRDDIVGGMILYYIKQANKDSVLIANIHAHIYMCL